MLKSIAILFAIFAVVPQCIATITADDCIGSFAALQALEFVRGNNNSIPATYVICPNTVFQFTEIDAWSLNGNTNYLCGSDGASSNNCVVTGGILQLEIGIESLDRSSKDNIFMSGFSFEKAGYITGIIVAPGKFTFRDCIFKDNTNKAVLSAVFYIPPKLPERSRVLGSLSNNKPDEAEYRNDIINFLKDPELRQQRMDDRNARSLLIGGGSEPRITLLLDRVQFLNNSLTSDTTFPSIGSNGPFDISTAFADVTVSHCLFKDNFYPSSQESLSSGFGIRVASSSTLNISNTCFVNNYLQGTAPVHIRSDSGFIASQNNYANEIQAIAPCQYMFMEEAYKCVAPESNVCGLPACAASYKLYNAGTDKFVTNIVNGETIRSPPCDLNIEVVLPCATTGKNVTLQLLRPKGNIVATRNQIEPFFLYGNQKANVLAGKLASGTYKIQAVVNGIVQPSPTTFTLAGRCVHR